MSCLGSTHRVPRGPPHNKPQNKGHVGTTDATFEGSSLKPEMLVLRVGGCGGPPLKPYESKHIPTSLGL